MKTVIGAFDDANEARLTFDELVRTGFGQSDISVVARPAALGKVNLDLRPMDTADMGRLAGRGPILEVHRSLAHRPEHGFGGLLRASGFSPAVAEHYARAVAQGKTLESLVVDDADADRAVSIMSLHAARTTARLDQR
jgi:hypothetical protein